LQYTSSATIAGLTTCDANAFRGTLAQLRALMTMGDDMAMTDAEFRNAVALGVGDALAHIAKRDVPGWRGAGGYADQFSAAVRNALGLPSGALSALLPNLEAILAAAKDDGNVAVTLDPTALTQLTEIRDALAALPGAVADEIHADPERDGHDT
jgi:hypothetical protein